MTTKISEKVIDQALALKLVDGNEALAYEIMGIMFRELPEHKRIIDTALQEKDFATLRKEVHKLLGATSYCGLPRLKTAVQQLDRALVEQEKKLQPLYETFCEEVNAVMREKDSYL